MSEKFEAWVTRHALTTGIEKHTLVQSEYCDTTACTLDNRNVQCFHKPYWHKSYADAVNHAESMRREKIFRLEKQIAKLKAMRFKL